MITQIKEYHTRWEQAKAENTYNKELVKKVSVFNAKYGQFAPIAPQKLQRNATWHLGDNFPRAYREGRREGESSTINKWVSGT